MKKVLCNVFLAMVALLFVLAGCGGRSTYMIDGYHSSTPHSELRDNPTYHYPPGAIRLGTPEDETKWAGVEILRARAEKERAIAGRESFRTDREAVARGGGGWGHRQAENFLDALREGGIYIINQSARGFGQGLGGGLRRGAEDAIRGR